MGELLVANLDWSCERPQQRSYDNGLIHAAQAEEGGGTK